MFTDLLSSLADFTWWIETNFSSVLLFGECEYPQKEDFE